MRNIQPSRFYIMNKDTLELMIKKYYLSNEIETSIWKIFNDKKQLRMAGSGKNQDLSVVVEYNNFTDLATTEFAVNDTTKLLKMLNVLDGDVKIAPKQDNNGKIYSIVVNSSNNIEIEYVTADINMIRSTNLIRIISRTDKQVPQVKILLDDDFISTYIASTTALPDSESVVFKMNKDNKLEMVFGHVQGANKALNTSKIKYQPKTVGGADVLPEIIGFKASHIKQILIANKECKDGVLELACYDSPIAYVKFVNTDMTSTYHFKGINVR